MKSTKQSPNQPISSFKKLLFLHYPQILYTYHLPSSYKPCLYQICLQLLPLVKQALLISSCSVPPFLQPTFFLFMSQNALLLQQSCMVESFPWRIFKSTSAERKSASAHTEKLCTKCNLNKNPPPLGEFSQQRMKQSLVYMFYPTCCAWFDPVQTMSIYMFLDFFTQRHK